MNHTASRPGVRVPGEEQCRGAAGVHPFIIDADGVYVYPRLESVVPTDTPPWTGERTGFGVSEIDQILGGGLNAGPAPRAEGLLTGLARPLSPTAPLPETHRASTENGA